MSRFQFWVVGFPAIAIGLSALVGCGASGSTVTGNVTFNGKPVQEGYVNFYPTDGKSAPAGGAIKDGRYSVRNVSPGKNRVEVTSTPTGGTAASSMEETVKSKETKRPDNMVAPNDQGNNATHEISGSTELNLDLKTSISSDGKR
jgi:hypothetical protein